MKAVLRKIVWCLFSLLFCFYTQAFGQDLRSLEIELTISVDWEGFSLDAENLIAFQQFRNEFPGIKIVHFLSAAYFTKPGVNALATAERIRSVMRAGDEVGLHLHAFESLTNTAGVAFRDSVTFWGRPYSEPINGDRGHDVPLSVFNKDELLRLIRTSKEILNRNGFGDVQSFRAGGWVATPDVLEVLALEGIVNDSSAVPTEFIAQTVGDRSPLYLITKSLWPDQTVTKDRPYIISTPMGDIVEFPNNIALADYVNGQQAFQYLQELVSKNFGAQSQIHFHYGFHQETAELYLPRVRTFIKHFNDFVSKYNVRVNSRTLMEMNPSEHPRTLVGPRVSGFNRPSR